MGAKKMYPTEILSQHILSLPSSIYESHLSAEISVPFQLSASEFIDLWQDSGEPFDTVLASSLRPNIELLFHYVYFYDPEDGTISDYDLQEASFREEQLLSGDFFPLLEEIAKKKLASVAEYVEGQCVDPRRLIYDWLSN